MSYKDTMTYQVNYVKYKEAIKRWLEIYHRKEVKKVKMSESDLKYYQRIDECMSENKAKEERDRPYFETKVVKISKKPIVSSKEWTPGYCPCCGQRTVEEKEGNWVNGENLNKIKFPCFCSFNTGMKKRYGELDFVYFEGEAFYRLRELKQSEAGLSVKYEYTDKVLNNLIGWLDIHILKGKVILYEEEVK